MRQRRFRVSDAVQGFLAAAILLGPYQPVHADSNVALSPVEALRRTLAIRATDSAKLTIRQREIETRLEALSKVADLRDALFLVEWRDGDVDTELAAVDRQARLALAHRLERGLAIALQSDDGTNQVAAANLIADLANRMRVRPAIGWSCDVFGPLLAELAIGPDATTSKAAVRALGSLGGDPDAAGGAFGSLITAEEPGLRRAAAEALLTTVESICRPREAGTRLGVELTPGEFLRTARVVVPLAAHGLSDADTEVRRLSIETLRRVTLLVQQLLTEQRTARSENVTSYHGDIRALAELLQARMPAVAPMLADFDTVVRRLAYQTLEGIARIARLVDARTSGVRATEQLIPINSDALTLRDAGVVPTKADAHTQQPGTLLGVDQPLLRGLQSTLPGVGAGVRDPDVFVRRASMDVLELLGDTAKPETPALVQALADPDLYVRWSAARTLGNLASSQPGLAVPALATLLDDTDMDVRYAAAESLRRFGPNAHDATPALVCTIDHPDAATRLASMRALQNIGVSAHQAVPALITAMAAPDAKVREAAAQFLGRFGPAAHVAVDTLRKALNDSDSAVRRAAGDALLEILANEKSSRRDQPTNAITPVSYLGTPTAVIAAVKWWNDRHIIATTPPAVPQTKFAADSRPPASQVAWRPATPITPAATLRTPAAVPTADQPNSP